MAFKDIAILLFFITILQSQLHKSIALDNQTWIKAGYWQYDTLNPPNIQSINSTLYTHLIYGFAELTFNTSTDQMFVTISDDHDEQVKNFNSIVKRKNPSLKTILSIGGTNQSSISSTMYLLMSNAYFPGRKYFIESSITIARSYGFDGLDFCWIWPSSSQEISNLATLLDDWRVAIDLESKQVKKPRLLLTMAGKYTPWIEDLSFPIESMRKNLDWLHVFAFDYYEPGTTNNTSPVAALYDPNSDLNTDYGINAWIKSGFPSQNLVLGLPFYGYVWTLLSPKNNQIGAMGTGPGPKDYSYGTEAFTSTNERMERNKIGNENNEEKGSEETRTLQIFSFDEMKEATNNFAVENELGKGGYGPVYKVR
ncbi:hypothetical protein T459_18915 [Capsicum annuum]|uniref:GH18 domain-containing protein n=1 Tax=Capsicum annuum TaxID=4072 RepID=A0A2G2Z088_CAPAN|nr:hypothetical protein T459_18915 [Capsicum annuum]